MNHTMKTITQKYLRAKHPDIAGGHDLMVQTAWPQIVASVRLFGPMPKNEESRREFLESYSHNAYYFAKANGYRIYVSVQGSLQPIEEQVQGWKELVHSTLQEMVEFYVSQISDGMRRQYSDLEY